MKLNTDKCKVMHLGRNNENNEYCMLGQKLQVVNKEKDLGIMISSDLKREEQCRYAANKANKVLGMVKRTIRNKDPVIMVRLYKALVRPHLEYCVSAWSPHYSKDKELLEKVQRRFTRMIKGMDQLSYMARLERLHLWTLEERRNRSDLIEVFKIIKGYSKCEISDFFIMVIHYKKITDFTRRVIDARALGDTVQS